MHRLMTLDDLYAYYSSQKESLKFDYQETQEPLMVEIGGNMSFAKDEDNAKEGLYATNIWLNFVGDNLNGSRIELKAQKKANASSAFRPLLAYIHDVDGEPQFYGHNFHQDDDGNVIYDEQPVGVISEEAHIEHDDKTDKDFAVANGYIWEEYSKAKDILERDGKCDVSVELAIRSLSYNAKDKILVLDDYYYSGCTILGCDENGNKVNPAMPGSNITLQDFSKSCYSASDNKLIETLDKLNETLAKFNIQADDSANTKEGGKSKVTFEELLSKYNKTVEDITFEYENLSSEELEAAFAEAFAEGEPDGDPDPENGEGVDDSENNTDETVPTENESVEFSVKRGDVVKTFSVSLNDKLNAMYNLVNETFGEQDNEWYDVVVFEDSKTVEMHGYFTGKSYRQSYQVRKDEFSLVGDRVEIFAKFMTQDEINAFDKMKADFEELQPKFAEVSDKLAKYEAEPQKMEIINNECYSSISDSDEFKAFAEKDAHFDMSVADVQAKCDEMLLAYAKNVKFSAEPENKVAKKALPMGKKESRYGTVFSNR